MKSNLQDVLLVREDDWMRANGLIQETQIHSQRKPDQPNIERRSKAIPQKLESVDNFNGIARSDVRSKSFRDEIMQMVCQNFTCI